MKTAADVELAREVRELTSALRDLVDELRQARVASLQATPPNDLVRQIAARFRDGFRSADVIAEAKRDPTLASALRAAFIDDPRQLGRVLSTLNHQIVERVGSDRRGARWRMRPTAVASNSSSAGDSGSDPAGCHAE